MGNSKSRILRSWHKNKFRFTDETPFLQLNNEDDPILNLPSSSLRPSIFRSNEERIKNINAHQKNRLHKESELKRCAQQKLANLQEAVENERAHLRIKLEQLIEASEKEIIKIEKRPIETLAEGEPHTIEDKEALKNATTENENIFPLSFFDLENDSKEALTEIHASSIASRLNEVKIMVDDLIAENMELTERKHALNVVKNDLIAMVDKLIDQREYLRKRNEDLNTKVKKLEHRVVVLEYILARSSHGSASYFSRQTNKFNTN